MQLKSVARHDTRLGHRTAAPSTAPSVSQKTKEQRIRIINPVPGEARYTSIDRAIRHCEVGIARMMPDGLFFFNNKRVQLRSRREEADHEIDVRRAGVLFWNGEADFLGRCRPGDVRS